MEDNNHRRKQRKGAELKEDAVASDEEERKAAVEEMAEDSNTAQVHSRRLSFCASHSSPAAELLSPPALRSLPRWCCAVRSSRQSSPLVPRPSSSPPAPSPSSSSYQRIPVPSHRYTPLRSQWMELYTPIVEHMKLQIRFNTRKRCIELRVRAQARTLHLHLPSLHDDCDSMLNLTSNEEDNARQRLRDPLLPSSLLAPSAPPLLSMRPHLRC